MRFSLLLALALLCAAPSLSRAENRKPLDRPNILFILADDLGWSDLGCQGSKYYETPNIDRLAQQGLTFTDASTAAPNCAPTRACLMTGRYTPRHGIYTVGTGARGAEKYRQLVPVENRTQLPLNEQTMAEALKANGYVTGIFGKWHLGEKGAYFPARRGFDEALVSMGQHFDFAVRPPVRVEPGTYLADYLTQRSLQFIEKNKDRPFFLYLPHFAVHTPLQAKQKLTEHFRHKKGDAGHDNPVYAAMIASVDESVGRILDKLAELQLEENTLIIFSSDNGGVGGYSAAGIRGAHDITSNRPLRAGKGTLYEGGVRVPFIVRWKGVIAPGSRCGEPIISVDLFPTFVELAGGKHDGKQKLDGVSLVSLLKASGRGQLSREALYWHFPGYLQANAKMGTWRTTPCGSIRCGDFKLLEFFEDGRLELYNLKDDLGQKNNLAAQLPAKTRELHQRLQDWRRAIHAPMPARHPQKLQPGTKSAGRIGRIDLEQK